MKTNKIKAQLVIKDLEGLSRVERNGLAVWLRNMIKDIKNKKLKFAKNSKWTIYY